MPASLEQQDQRRRAIAEILRDRAVATQSELVRLLHDQGFDATQSSVSRDLRILGAAKESDGYRLHREPPAGDDLLVDVAGFVRAVKKAGVNLVVIQTAIGAAQRVAVALDRCGWPEIVGTLSGDDTIFVATSGAASSGRLVARLNRLFAEFTA